MILTSPLASPASQTHPLPNWPDAGGVEFFLESFEVAKGLLDHVADGAGGIASAVGLHDLPEHGVVDVASAIVADGAANVFGDGVQVADEIFRALACNSGCLSRAAFRFLT